jgi:hypothetical protein
MRGQKIRIMSRRGQKSRIMSMRGPTKVKLVSMKSVKINHERTEKSGI